MLYYLGDAIPSFEQKCQLCLTVCGPLIYFAQISFVQVHMCSGYLWDYCIVFPRRPVEVGQYFIIILYSVLRAVVLLLHSHGSTSSPGIRVKEKSRYGGCWVTKSDQTCLFLTLKVLKLFVIYQSLAHYFKHNSGSVVKTFYWKIRGADCQNPSDSAGDSEFFQLWHVRLVCHNPTGGVWGISALQRGGWASRTDIVDTVLKRND